MSRYVVRVSMAFDVPTEYPELRAATDKTNRALKELRESGAVLVGQIVEIDSTVIDFKTSKRKRLDPTPETTL